VAFVRRILRGIQAGTVPDYSVHVIRAYRVKRKFPSPGGSANTLRRFGTPSYVPRNDCPRQCATQPRNRSSTLFSISLTYCSKPPLSGLDEGRERDIREAAALRRVRFPSSCSGYLSRSNFPCFNRLAEKRIHVLDTAISNPISLPAEQPLAFPDMGRRSLKYPS